MTKKLRTFALLRPAQLVLFSLLLTVILMYVPWGAFKAVLVVSIIVLVAVCQRKNLRILKEQAGLLEYVRLPN